MEQVFLSVKQVASLLGVNPRTVYNMCWGNKIPYIKLGGAHIRIHKDAVKLLVEDAAKLALLPRSPRGGGGPPKGWYKNRLLRQQEEREAAERAAATAESVSPSVEEQSQPV